MNRFRSLGLVAVVLAASPLMAVCTFQATASRPDTHTIAVTWSPVPGATQYYVETSTDNFATVQRTPIGGATSFSLVRTNSAFLTSYYFRITAAEGPDNAACVATTSTIFMGDLPFRSKITRTIVPVVAKIAGANGSDFKTSLRLTAVTSNTGHGKIIFHPAGQQGSDADPTITYAFNKAWQVIEYDDILGAFGVTGVGSLDIVPDLEQSNQDAVVPMAQARLYNQTSNGTFGSFEHHVQPIDFLASTEVRGRASANGQYRVNIGFRTISTSTLNFDVYDVNGDARLHRSFTYPPNYTLLTSPEALLGTSLAPGESVGITTERGSAAIPFYTYTDNGTNDPTIFVPEFSVKIQLGTYELPGVVTLQ